MKYRTRSDAASTVAKALRRKGCRDATTENVKRYLDDWLDGKRGEVMLQQSTIGRLASKEFDEVAALRPGFLEGLKNDETGVESGFFVTEAAARVRANTNQTGDEK